jgi:hypothetical protein
VAAFMFRKTIITGLLTATLGPRAAEITAGMHATTDDSGGRVKSWEDLSTATIHGKQEVNKEKATGASQKGQRSRQKPKKEEETAFDMEKLTKFMISLQHSMGDGYARRKCDNCWEGKSIRDDDEGVLPTLCTGCETRKGLFASEQKQLQVWGRAKEMATLLPKELRPRNCARATRKERMYMYMGTTSPKNTWQSTTTSRERRTTKTSCRSRTSAAHRRRRRSSTGSPTEKGRT